MNDKFRWVPKSDRVDCLVSVITGLVVGEARRAASHLYGRRTEPIEWWRAYAFRRFIGEYMGRDAAHRAIENEIARL